MSLLMIEARPDAAAISLAFSCTSGRNSYLAMILREKKNSVVFGFEVHPAWEFISMILGFREQARVVSPAWFRDYMIGIIEAMRNSYQGKPA
jgi:predicted DNA-binding transcriptional regulator YafY